MRIRLAPKARADLDEIWQHIARESGSTSIATRVIASITEKFALFAGFPYIGRGLESDGRPNIRAFPVNNYVIFYSVKPPEIRILRIIHGNRDLQALLNEG